MAANDEKFVLEGKEAINLWLEGRDAWNDWVREHPVADVDFSFVEFSQHRAHPHIRAFEWPFSNFLFPSGDIYFTHASFGDGAINFGGASFGDGDANFGGVLFGEGTVNFGGVSFGDGGVIFTDAEFGEGDVYFHEVKFGEGGTSFEDASFGEGTVSFSNASFENGSVGFLRTSFGKGNTSFWDVSFGNEGVQFWDASFGEGDIEFTGASFGEGGLNFDGASFAKGDVGFEFTNFEGRATFSNLKNVSVVERFSFAHSTFQSSLSISSDEPFGCVVDLTSTKMSNQVSLDGLRCTLKKTKSFWGSEWLGRAKALDVDDIARFRRLKEIAGNNKDHEQALNFNVMEMQAKRWHKTSIAGLFLEFVFQITSYYGRSEIRAFLWMVFLCVACSRAYLYWSDTVKDHLCEPSGKVWVSITFSLGQMLSFVPVSGTARAGGANCLFQLEQLPSEVIFLASFQSVISIILIFLIGLSLRNRFKV